MTEEERAALYRDSRVQSILEKFLNGEIKELIPEFDPAHGLKFKGLETIVEAGAPDLAGLMERLSSAGVFKRKFHEKSLICPSCGSSNIAFRYHCVHCNSTDIERKELCEHPKCGAIDDGEHFRQKEKVICPKCQEELTSADYRKIGAWFQCRACAKKFDLPVGRHECRNCKTTFTIGEALLGDLYSYTLSSEAENELKKQYALLLPIMESLKRKGFTVESHGTLIGNSGASYVFDIVATRLDQNTKSVTAVNVISAEKPVGEEPLTTHFAKSYDLSPARSILVVIPGLNETAKKLASHYKVLVVEAERIDDVPQKLEQMLGY